MQAIPYRLNEDEYNVCLILEDENVARIKDHDPAELIISYLPEEWRQLRLNTVIITYASGGDLLEMRKLLDAGEIKQALRFLCRGFRFRPDKGDADLKTYPSTK